MFTQKKIDFKNLPKEVLDLFPKWSYECPNCGKQYDDAVQVCTQCKTKYEESKWKIPPQFLKSYEAMSEYAHNVLAPKLAPKERKLLFEFFTEFFSDGFEDGTFDAWDNSGGSIVTTPIHHADYAARFTASADSDVHACKILSSDYSTIYTRLYFCFTTMPTTNGNVVNIIEYKDSSSNVLCSAKLAYSSGTGLYHLNLIDQSGGGNNGESSDSEEFSLSEKTWYCLEFARIAGSDGFLTVYLNGDNMIYWEIDTGSALNRQVWIGAVWAYQNLTIYTDCVVVADTPIGPEEDIGAIFTDSFESESLPGAWDGYNGSPNVVSSVSHHGIYCLECNSNDEFVYKDFTSQTTLHARAYYRLSELPSSTGYVNIMRICSGSGVWGTLIGRLQLLHTVSGLTLSLESVAPSATYYYIIGGQMSVDNWYCFEVKFVKSDSMGEWRVYFNGAEVITQTGLDTSSNANVKKIAVGRESTDTINPTINVDCVVVDHTYIGTETDFDSLVINRKTTLPSNESAHIDPQELVNAIYAWTTSLLESDAPSGAENKDVVVNNGELFSAGDYVAIRDDNGHEFGTIDTISDNTLTMTVPLSHNYTTAANGAVDKWSPAGFTLPDNLLQLGDDSDPTNLSLFLVRDAYSNAPLFVIDQGMIVQKDFTAGGFIGTNQGEVWIGHGRNISTDPPTIRLTHSGSEIDGTANVDTNFIPLKSTFGFNVGDSVLIADNINSESKTVSSISPAEPVGIYTTTNLSQSYTEDKDGYVHNYDTLHIERYNGTLANVKLERLIANQVRTECNAPQLTNSQIIKEVYWFDNGVFSPVEPPSDTDFPSSPNEGDLFNHTDKGLFYQYDGSEWVNLGPTLGKLPTGLSTLLFKDNKTNNFLSLFLTISSENDDDTPILTTDQSLLVKKNVSVGGFLGSNQGAVVLGSGLTNQVDEPKIVLSNSDVSRLQGGGSLSIPAVPSGPSLPEGVEGQVFILNSNQHLYKHNGDDWVDEGSTSNFDGNFDTLKITKANGSDLANMKLNTLTADNINLVEGSTVTALADYINELAEEVVNEKMNFVNVKPNLISGNQIKSSNNMTTAYVKDSCILPEGVVVASPTGSMVSYEAGYLARALIFKNGAGERDLARDILDLWVTLQNADGSWYQQYVPFKNAGGTYDRVDMIDDTYSGDLKVDSGAAMLAWAMADYDIATSGTRYQDCVRKAMNFLRDLQYAHSVAHSTGLLANLIYQSTTDTVAFSADSAECLLAMKAALDTYGDALTTWTSEYSVKTMANDVYFSLATTSYMGDAVRYYATTVPYQSECLIPFTFKEPIGYTQALCSWANKVWTNSGYRTTSDYSSQCETVLDKINALTAGQWGGQMYVPYTGQSDETQFEYSGYTALMTLALNAVNNTKYAELITKSIDFLRWVALPGGRIYDFVDKDGSLWITQSASSEEGYGFLTLPAAQALLAGA